MLQIVTLCGGYLYRIAYLCIMNLTECAMWFNNFVVLKIFIVKTADNKIAD